MEFYQFILLVLLWIVIAILCSYIANVKGYSRFAWFFAGLLLSFLALLVIMSLPDKKMRKYLKTIADKQKAIEDKWFNEKEGNLREEWKKEKEWEEPPSDDWTT